MNKVFDFIHPHEVKITNIELLEESCAVHAEFDISMLNNVKYKPGDCILIWPKNDSKIVDKILNILNVSSEEKRKQYKHLLINECEIDRVSKIILTTIMNKHPNSIIAKELELVVEDSRVLSKYLTCNSLLDVLSGTMGLDIDAESIISLLKKIKPRWYSITSCCEKNINSLSILVAPKYKYSVFFDGNIPGTTYTYLKNSKIGDKAKIAFYENDNFKLDNFDLNNDMIMICSGTGLAPFVSFIEQRDILKGNGKNILFYGTKNEKNILYKEKLKRWQKSGLLDLIIIFAEDNEQYITSDIIKNEEKILNVVRNNGKIYLCGSAKKLNKRVEAVLKKILVKCSKNIESLKKSQQYFKDVY